MRKNYTVKNAATRETLSSNLCIFNRLQATFDLARWMQSLIREKPAVSAGCVPSGRVEWQRKGAEQ
jgi:hypothetical protein